MRRMSTRRRREALAYSEERKWFLAKPENSKCPVAAAGLIPTLFGELVPHFRSTTEVHHVFRRGKFYLDATTWLGVSSEGHDWIEANPAKARGYGWLCDTQELQEIWRSKRKK